MPAKCGSQGPMLCLYGSVCNDTTGVCQDCPAGVINDQVIFKGNQNCGLAVTGMICVYVIVTFLSVMVSGCAFKIAREKRKSRMRKLLWLVSFWTLLIPCLMLSHYLEGFSFGIASVIFLTLILILVSLQTSMFQYTMDTFMGVLCNYSSPETMYQKELIWFAIWTFQKFIVCVLLVVSIASENDDWYNAMMLCVSVFVVIELACNVIRGSTQNKAMVRAVEKLKLELQSNQNSINPIVKEFAERVHDSRFVGPTISSLFMGLGVALIILFIKYDSAIPYAFVIYDILNLAWPLIGLIPMAVLRSKLGTQLDKSKTRGSSGRGRTVDDSQANDFSRSPTSTTQKRNTKALVSSTNY